MEALCPAKLVKLVLRLKVALWPAFLCCSLEVWLFYLFISLNHVLSVAIADVPFLLPLEKMYSDLFGSSLQLIIGFLSVFLV